MQRIVLTNKIVISGVAKHSAVSILKGTILQLPFWKDGMNVSKVSACIEIDDALDKISDKNLNLDITQEAWTFLKEAMQLLNVGPTNWDPAVNRLYMDIYKSVLGSISIEEK